MIEHIEGRLIEKNTGYAVISTGHLGLQCIITLHTFDKLPAEGHTCRLLTYLHVREDLLQLFAFADEEERRMFHKLISLSGIGPKQAVNILSGIRYDRMTEYILNGDVTAVKAAPGVGEKTARRIILELKDKMSDAEVTSLSGIPEGSPLSRHLGDALLALESLGYKKSQIKNFFSKHINPDEELRTQDIIKRFLNLQNKS